LLHATPKDADEFVRNSKNQLNKCRRNPGASERAWHWQHLHTTADATAAAAVDAAGLLMSQYICHDTPPPPPPTVCRIGTRAPQCNTPPESTYWPEQTTFNHAALMSADNVKDCAETIGTMPVHESTQFF